MKLVEMNAVHNRQVELGMWVYKYGGAQCCCLSRNFMLSQFAFVEVPKSLGQDKNISFADSLDIAIWSICKNLACMIEIPDAWTCSVIAHS